MNKNRGNLIKLDVTILDLDGAVKAVSFDKDQIESRGEFMFNSSEYGGEVIKVQMEIEYPDGSRKTVGHGAKWADITHKIIINEDKMSEKHISMMTNSPNWQENAAMVRVLVDGTFHKICMRPGHGGDDQTKFFSIMF